MVAIPLRLLGPAIVPRLGLPHALPQVDAPHRRVKLHAARQVDYYQILELDNKNASETEIKAAYRKLARRYHPDVNSSPQAAAIFQNLTRAFETLCDQERRRDYDENLATFSGWAPSGASSPQSSGTNLHISLSISLVESVLGTTRRVAVQALSRCPQCKGSGGAPGGRSERCQVCKGRGDIYRTRITDTGDTATKLMGCPGCGGKGILIIDCCTRCQSTGLAKRKKEIELKVPAGIENGTTLRVAGQGDAGEVEGDQGDLLVQISVLQDTDIQRQGMDLYSDVKVPFFMAILGGTIKVNTVQSGTMPLVIPPGTSHGTQLSLKKEGVLGKGSHHFKVRVVVPRKVNESEEALLRQLAVLKSKP